MKKTFLKYAMMAIAMMAMSVTMVSCGDDDEVINDPTKNEVDNTKPHTFLFASVKSNLYQYIDISFKMDGKDITMTTESYGDSCVYKYTDDKLNEGAKIEATVTLKSGVNVDDMPENFTYNVVRQYMTGKWDDEAASKISFSGSGLKGSGQFSKIIDRVSAVTNKQEAVEYVIEHLIKGNLDGTIKKSN